jgi:hypothetical protein
LIKACEKTRSLVLAFALFSLILVAGACKSVTTNSNSANTAVASSIPVVASSPPFPTKEPDRYQAKIVTSFSFPGSQSSLAASIGSLRKEIFVARDGLNRRQDFELTPGTRLTVIESEKGRFLLLPSKKLYAELKDDDLVSGSAQSETPGLSPNRLLTEFQPSTSFERLGTEVKDGRTTTKYRARVKRPGENNLSETLIWVDEALGMPVRSETISKTESQETGSYAMEVQDVRLEVDPALFQVPSDFTRVDHDALTSQIESRGVPKPNTANH